MQDMTWKLWQIVEMGSHYRKSNTKIEVRDNEDKMYKQPAASNNSNKFDDSISSFIFIDSIKYSVFMKYGTVVQIQGVWSNPELGLLPM